LSLPGSYGMSESQIRSFLQRELLQSSSTSSFYWESDELEDAVQLVIEAVTRLMVANNARLAADIKGNVLKDAKLPPGFL
jgi:hypothetical protein